MRIRALQTEGFRLSAIYVAAFALSVLVMGGVVIAVTNSALRDQLVQSSRADIAAMAHGYATEGVPEAQEVMQQLMGAPGGSDFFLLQKGKAHVAGNLPVMAPQTGIVTLPGTAPHHEILGVGAYLAPNIYVFSGSDLHRLHAAQDRLIRILLWLFVPALLLAILGGALVSHSFLRRTDAMARACRAIMDGDLKARIPVRGTQDELDRLAGTINEMLGRIAALMENLRQVTNDIAHDLRTPVTHLRNRLERARSECASEKDYAQALEAAITKSDEILALFAALLRIAQIEGGARRAGFATLELASLLAHLRELFDAVADEAGDRLKTEVRDRVSIRGDRELLIQLLSNLIENAILHTPSGTRIVLSLSRSDDRAVITVSDNGPGVPKEEHDKLFQRLYRREASRNRPGYGLGLSLVSAIAELHGGAIDIRDVPGFSVAVSFPLA
ncbi:MAG TPA: HAMP domain-containing sensor histidine kinase [Rhizomicrobium sp.]|nr:HAMP domain-containing sensor histidine kinase [Rhizomicrobium sp.]